VKAYESLPRDAIVDLVNLCVTPLDLALPSRELPRQVHEFLETASISPWQRNSREVSLTRFATVFWPWWCACTRVLEWLGGAEVLLPVANPAANESVETHAPASTDDFQVLPGFVTGAVAKQRLACANVQAGSFIVRLSESKAGHIVVSG
jgi:hypothetical protein